MHKKTVIVALSLLTAILVGGCAPIPPVQSGWDYYPPDTNYLVFGRVMNFMHQPVPDCKVVLIRRKAKSELSAEKRAKATGPEDTVVVAEYLVATSSVSGDYSFNFEPWGAYDVWLYFDATEQGYVPQTILLNDKIRAKVARGIGKTPLSVDVLLEPIQK